MNIKTALTRECDKHIRPDCQKTLEAGLCSYLCEKSEHEKGRLYLRFPGATRGIVEFDSTGRITAIHLSDHTAFTSIIACYQESLREAVKAFIGRNVFEGREDNLGY